jgi:hypothetical protein
LGAGNPEEPAVREQSSTIRDGARGILSSSRASNQFPSHFEKNATPVVVVYYKPEHFLDGTGIAICRTPGRRRRQALSIYGHGIRNTLVPLAFERFEASAPRVLKRTENRL